MRVIHRVYRLWATRPYIDPELRWDEPDIGEWLQERFADSLTPAEMIELAGRVCYRSFHNPSGRTTAEYVDNLIRQGHWSVLEHVSVGYLICTTREVTHELVRHRHLSYSQESTRYVRPSPPLASIPEYVLDRPESQRLVEEWLRLTEALYQTIEELAQGHYSGVEPGYSRKLVRQDARRVLPMSLPTRIVVTGNLRAWMEAIAKRIGPEADWPIRRVMLEVLADLTGLVPEVFEGRWEQFSAPDGHPAARVRWGTGSST